MVIPYQRMSRISCTQAQGILDNGKKFHPYRASPSLSECQLSLTQAP